MYTRILVPLDGSTLAEQVLPYVRILGNGFRAPVELLRLVDSVPAGRANAGTGSEARSYLEGVAASLRKEGVTVSSTVREGDAASCIVTEAGKNPDTLVAMSTHGRSGITRWVLGSVMDKVLQATTSPLLIVRSHHQEDSAPDVKLETVILPLDGSALAEQALPHAVALARALGLKVTLVRVIPPPGQYYIDIAYPPGLHDDLPRQVEQEAVDYLAQVRQKLSQEGVSTVQRHLMRGHPATAIVDFAQEVQHNLVAMTTHGRSGVGRWVLGSVTDRVVQHSGGPVLVIRPKRE